MTFKAIRAVLLASALSYAPDALAAGFCGPSGCATSVSNFPPAYCSVTGTISAAGALGATNASVVLPCPQASAYIIDITPTVGSPLVGTLSSTDSSSGGGRILFKAGVGSLGIVSLPFTGVGGSTVEYRTVGGGNGQAITATALTSGSATVTIFGTAAPSIMFINGSVATTEEVAVRQGRGFSVSSGSQSVSPGQYENLLLSNPAGSTSRLLLTNRTVYCNTATGTATSLWYSLSDPTVGLPTGSMTPTNRKQGSGASVATATSTASTATLIDTSPTTPLTSRIGGVVPTGGVPGGGPGTVMRTIEPGHSYDLSVFVPTGTFTAAQTCGVNFVWYEEPLQ